MNDETYKLDELARAAGTSARTVRYYVQRGLLRAPAFKGKDTAYGRDHLVRLRAIRKLQDAFFPLDAIAAELEQRSDAEIERIADGVTLPRAAHLGLASELTPAQNTPTQDTTDEPVNGGRATSDPSSDAVQAHTKAGMPQERVYRRIELAPGVELSIADDAPHASREIAARILEAVRP